MEIEKEPTLICVTPIKNEAWILERFIQCASQWADHIIIADQQSTDGSREIAQRYPRVHLIDNDQPSYNEQARQKLLLEAARRIPVPGKRIIIALDADEMLTANWAESPDWRRVRAAEPGTVLYFQWVNVAPDFERAWLPGHDIPFGYVDDGRPHTGYKIHSPRVPVYEGAPSISFRDIKVLHYQYTNWQRMKSKQRWYQCWERINHPEKRPVTLYRQYNFMDAAFTHEATPMRPEWLAGYERAGIDMRTVAQESYYYWDAELVRLFQEQGVDRFRKLNVWDVDWSAIATSAGRPPANGELKDPRTAAEKAVHKLLGATQPYASNPALRLAQKCLQAFGW